MPGGATADARGAGERRVPSPFANVTAFGSSGARRTSGARALKAETVTSIGAGLEKGSHSAALLLSCPVSSRRDWHHALAQRNPDHRSRRAGPSDGGGDRGAT